jgi:hypothetical protein
MAYRDPVAAARARVEEAQRFVDGLEERITPALLEQLPANLSASLTAAAQAATDATKRAEKKGELELMRAAEKALGAYADWLEKAVARAPRLGRNFNRLPRHYPERATPHFAYEFPDVFSKAQLSLRESLHTAIDGIDPKARLFDRRTGYFDANVAPYLVEACFRVDWNPIRLQVCCLQRPVNRTTGYHVELLTTYGLYTGVRPSTPELRVTPDGLASGFLSMLGMLRDTEIGSSELDEALVIEADPEDAERVLAASVRAALLQLMRSGELQVLEIRDGLARVEWQEDVTIRASYGGEPRHPFTCTGLTDAVDVLVGIRRTPPTPLLRRLQRERGQRSRKRRK